MGYLVLCSIPTMKGRGEACWYGLSCSLHFLTMKARGEACRVSCSLQFSAGEVGGCCLFLCADLPACSTLCSFSS